MNILKEGAVCPEFSLTSDKGENVSLKNIKTSFIVLFFYPKDSTPGCTIEAKQFTKHNKALQDLGATVFGISGGDEKSKAKFCQKHALDVTLLSDIDFSVAKSFGVYGEKKFMGIAFKGIQRSTFIIDKNRKIIKVYESASTFNNASEVLEFIKSCK